LVALALLLAACGTAAPPAPVPFEPYIAVDSAAPGNLAAVAAGTRAAAVRLAFVTGDGCAPVWGDGGPADLPALRREVAAVRARGVRVTVAFGGDGAAELASTCTDVDRLEAAYGAVLDAYRPAAVDLDIEGDQLTDRAATARRIAALRLVSDRLAAAGRRLSLVWTLPVEAGSGLGPDAVALLRASRAADLPVTSVNVLAMDYGTGAPGVTSLGAAARDEAGRAERVVRRIWSLSAAAAHRRTAVTVMIGRNDTPGETFTLADAAALARFAAAYRLGGLSYWSAGRDRACPGGRSVVSAACSGVAQRPFQFAAALSGRRS
jgi:chitinase